MEDCSSRVDRSSAQQTERAAGPVEGTSEVTQSISGGGSSVVEELARVESCDKLENTPIRIEGSPLKMDVGSPNNKMELGSPKMEVSSPKTEAASPKMDVASPNMEVSSPNMEEMSTSMEIASPKTELASSKMDVTSPKTEEGSAKMEEVAVKMGEVSVKSEETFGKSKDSVRTEEGSAKMEEVAVKMGEVSVKSEENSAAGEDIPIETEKGSAKMEEVSVKMGKVSVKSGPLTRDTTVKAEEGSEKKIQVYRGTACVTEGEVPHWLTVDLLVRAIRNDKPGTKKPQIRPFGSPTAKTRPSSQGYPAGKVTSLSRDHSMDTAFTSHHMGRPSGSHVMNEPSGSQFMARPSSSQSLSRPSTSQSISLPSTSQAAGKPSTSQSSSSSAAGRPSGSHVVPPSSTPSDGKTASTLTKGKSSRIKGKSSLSLHKGKAPASEISSRACAVPPDDKGTTSGAGGHFPDKQSENKSFGSGVEDKVSNSNQEGKNSADKEGTSDDNHGRSIPRESSVGTFSEDNIEKKIPSGKGERDLASSGSDQGDQFVLRDNPIEKIGDASRASEVCTQSRDSGICDDSQGAPEGGISNSNPGPKVPVSSQDKMITGQQSDGESSEMFKKPTDPPKRSHKKPAVPQKGAIKKQDCSKGMFKKPMNPPKRTVRKLVGPTESVAKIHSETPKVRFKNLELPVKETLKMSSDVSGNIVKNPDEPSKGRTGKPVDPSKRTRRKSPAAPKKPKPPRLQVIRFISQRLSIGNTVYRVRATAVCGSVARDCHLVVKLCSNTAEVTYYKKVAPRIPYVPRVLLCQNNIVVMDDLVHEGFRRPRGKFTPAQMTVAIDGLARMHTASVVALKRDPFLLDAFPQAAKATESDIARDLRLLADRVKAWSLPDADYYAARCRALAECVPYLLERLEPADTNMTVLLHGNVSPRNVFFLYDSRNPKLPAMASFVDFANVYWGHPALDISLVTGRAGGFWEGYKIVLLSLLTRASGRMWMPQPEIKDCGETYAFALLRAVCSSVSGSAAKALEEKLQELFPVFRQYSWLDFW